MQQKIFIPEGLTCKSPYVYWIQHIPSMMLYHGRKYEESTCDSSTFMTKSGYQTSSIHIKELIERDVLESFRVLCIRHFATAQEVIDYEKKFLVKIDAKNHPRYINKSNGGAPQGPHLEETKKKLSIAKKGKPLSDKHKANMRKPKSEKHKENMRGHKISNVTREKLSNASKDKPKSLEHRNKLCEAWKRRLPTSDITREKLRENNKGCRHWNNGVISKFCKECPEGDNWVHGMLKNK